MVIISTTRSSTWNSALRPHSPFLYLVWYSEQISYKFLETINRLLFLMEEHSVLCEAGTEF